MTTLTEFLQARLAEDEQAALAATPQSWKVIEWSNDDGGTFLVVADFNGPRPAVSLGGSKNAEHIARHDPARVLAEVEAKRRIIEQYERAYANRQAHPDDLASAGALLALHGVVGSLALPYADHPDYDPGWKP